jgi:hypothetical protein
MTEVLAGVIGPLTVAALSWVVMERTYRHNAQQMTAVMIAAFVAKMLFFGAYTAVALEGFDLRPVPFAATLISCFIALHMIEAFCLRRLFSGEIREPR